MGTINPSIPTIGQPNSTEDADIRDGMVTIRDEINGNLDNDNIKAAANIAGSKLATNSVAPSKLSNATSGQLLIANASGVITATTVSGDVTINNAGTTTISASAVGTTEIADDSITHIKMADNSVGNDEMRDAAVNTTELVDNAVTTAKVTNDAITADKLKDSASTDADRAVTTNHIRNSAITKNKISYSTISNNYAGVIPHTVTNAFTTLETTSNISNGVYMVAGSVIYSLGSSSTLDTVTTQVTGYLNYPHFQEEIDPIVGTAANYERFTHCFNFILDNTDGTITLKINVKGRNTGGASPANCNIIGGSYSIFGIQA